MILVYICHPYEGAGDPSDNQAKVAAICREIIEEDPNILPIAPQLYLYRFINEVSRDRIMDYCCSLLQICDEMWVCGNVVTTGMKLELEYAFRRLACERGSDTFKIVYI